MIFCIVWTHSASVYTQGAQQQQAVCVISEKTLMYGSSVGSFRFSCFCIAFQGQLRGTFVCSGGIWLMFVDEMRAAAGGDVVVRERLSNGSGVCT